MLILCDFQIKILLKNYWRATEFLPEICLHCKESKQERGRYFFFFFFFNFKFVSSLYSLMNRMLQQMKRKEILFEIFDVFRVEEEKMIVFTPRGLYDRVHTIN